MGGFITYWCEQCGHEVLSEKQPQAIKWTDGHICKLTPKKKTDKGDPTHKFNHDPCRQCKVRIQSKQTVH